MGKEYAFELEVQGAVKTFLTIVDSDESFEYQNIRQSAVMNVYAELCQEARRIIGESKTHMMETERRAFQEFSGGYIEELDEINNDNLSPSEIVAQEIETRGAVNSFFKRGDTRLYRFLGKEDFFKNYAMISDNARRIIIKERKHSMVREQTSEQFFGNGTPTAFETRVPFSPAIEAEVVESVDCYLEHDDCNFKTLSEDDFFREYAKRSYEARKLAVEKRQEMTATDMLNEQPQPEPVNNHKFI